MLKAKPFSRSKGTTRALIRPRSLVEKTMDKKLCLTQNYDKNYPYFKL